MLHLFILHLHLFCYVCVRWLERKTVSDSCHVETPTVFSWFLSVSTGLMPSMQILRSRCTESAASFECSQEPTEWRSSLRRTPVDTFTSLDVTLFSSSGLPCVMEFLEYFCSGVWNIFQGNQSLYRSKHCLLQCVLYLLYEAWLAFLLGP